jgi:hypothetical protein
MIKSKQGDYIMHKRNAFKTILLIIIIFAAILFGLFFFNFDHLTAGKLSKVEVVLKDPVTQSQSSLATLSDEKSLKELTSIFFGKFNEDFLSDTAEDSLLSVKFTFEKKVIEFKLLYTNVSEIKKYTYFKYSDRRMKFTIPSSHSERLNELLP